jgi:hypothetical protein
MHLWSQFGSQSNYQLISQKIFWTDDAHIPYASWGSMLPGGTRGGPDHNVKAKKPVTVRSPNP